MKKNIIETPVVAVLTGDLIGSTHLSPEELETVRAYLLATIQEVKGWKAGLVRSKAEFFRGDSWQLLLADASQALRVAVYIRAALIVQGKVDTRISIGIGRAEYISPRRVSLSLGQAFNLSGRALDAMRGRSALAISIGYEPGLTGRWLSVIGNLCDALIRNWTARQAQIVMLAAHPGEPVHEVIAKTLNPIISKQAVAKALSGAGWASIHHSIQVFEETPWKALSSNGVDDKTTL